MWSHNELVKREMGTTPAQLDPPLGTLPEQTWVGSFGKESGEIWAQNSVNVMGNGNVAPFHILEAIKKQFK
jgi:hypothetical protein